MISIGAINGLFNNLQSSKSNEHLRLLRLVSPTVLMTTRTTTPASQKSPPVKWL